MEGDSEMRTSLAETRNSFTTAIQGELSNFVAAILPSSLYDEASINIDETALDVWRGTDASHLVHPTWRVYGSLVAASGCSGREWK
jgi:hypothetical protein